MDNPIELPRNPNASLRENAEDFVRDYVYGVVTEGWITILKQQSGRVYTRQTSDSEPYENKSNSSQIFNNKWVAYLPSRDMLYGLGYLEQIVMTGEDGRSHLEYRLSRLAFDLLDNPPRRIRIFISYKRSESSAFALLLEARLRLKGVREDYIFIDKSIPNGDLWEQRIRDKIKACDYFISLVGQTTLGSPNVNNELDWAIEDGKSPITICHNGMTASAMTRDDLKKYNGYDIKDENALDYEQAVSHILNQLQYSTY